MTTDAAIKLQAVAAVVIALVLIWAKLDGWG